MGRQKIEPERKAKGLSVSLSPLHKERLNTLKEFFGLRKNSDIIQHLIDREYKNSVKRKGA